MGTNFFLRHHNLGDLLSHFAETTGSHLLKGSIYQGHIWKHRGKGSSSWDLMGFHNAYVAIVRSAFSNINVFFKDLQGYIHNYNPEFWREAEKPSSLVVWHSGIFRRQAALWASSAHWAADGVSGAENKPLGRWNWIGFNWLLCYLWEIKVNGICF
jgi:hypothetical protein